MLTEPWSPRPALRGGRVSGDPPGHASQANCARNKDGGGLRGRSATSHPDRATSEASGDSVRLRPGLLGLMQEVMSVAEGVGGCHLTYIQYG